MASSQQPQHMRLLDAAQKPWIELRDAGELCDVVLFLDEAAHEVRFYDYEKLLMFVFPFILMW